MFRIESALRYIQARLPVFGILAFSLCSVSAMHGLLASMTDNPIEALWLAAILAELMTAWVVGKVVETFRHLTKSKISKQDRKFYGVVLAAFVLIAVPSLAAVRA